jgi:hypothetical protein
LIALFALFAEFFEVAILAVIIRIGGRAMCEKIIQVGFDSAFGAFGAFHCGPLSAGYDATGGAVRVRRR